MTEFPVIPRTAGEDEARGVFEQRVGHTEAPEVAAIAARLIAQHPRLRHIDDFEVAYLEQHGAQPSAKDRHYWAKTRMVPKWLLPLCRYDAAVVVNHDVWMALPEPQREALVLHELLHLGLSDKGALEVVGHDVEEFGYVAATYGQWRPSLRHFAEQLGMGLEAG